MRDPSIGSSQRNLDVPYQRAKFVPEAASIDATQGLYQPLLLGHIRILELLPGHYGDDIQCHLHDVALEQNQFAYDALSYTWELHIGNSGSSEATEDPTVFFTCKELEVVVQRNLQDALRRMRDVQCSKYLWVSVVPVAYETPFTRPSLTMP